MAVMRMNEIFHDHIPVLLKEVLQNFIHFPDGIYVDATLGRGSHTKAILDHLSPQGRLIALDQDPEAVAYAKQHIHDPRFSVFHTSFTRLQMLLNEKAVFGRVNGILFDLGVSSPQLDQPERGFSFLREGGLDMRMDTTRGITAMQWLAMVDEKTLADVLWQYGEEKCSRRIARAIVMTRSEQAIKTTVQLAEIISRAMPASKKQFDKHPATRSFQAIRIAVNDELTALQKGLEQALDALTLGGRLAVISFHSLEDRLVKQFIRQHVIGQDLPRGLPIKEKRFNARLKAIGKAIKPSLQEIHTNPRARSAILRIAEKLS